MERRIGAKKVAFGLHIRVPFLKKCAVKKNFFHAKVQTLIQLISVVWLSALNHKNVLNFFMKHNIGAILYVRSALIDLNWFIEFLYE